ncbi:MAG: AraC family transcriptional regulator [Casimicrobiaceae bacterium]
MSTAVRVLQGRFGRVALLDMDRPLVIHAHRQCHVLLKASGSNTFFCIRDALYPLTERTAVLVNAWEPHCYAHHDPLAPRTVILALYIEPEWLAQSEKPLFASRHPAFFPKACARITDDMRALADKLTMAMLFDDDVDPVETEELLFRLMMAVITRFTDWHHLKSMRAMGPPRSVDRRIRRAMHYLREHAGRVSSMDLLVREACLSRAQFFKLFHQETDLTPSVYANVIRMETALQSLARSDEAVTDLSARLGFSASGHFTRFFQQHIGVAPSGYRRVADVVENTTGRSAQ